MPPRPAQRSFRDFSPLSLAVFFAAVFCTFSTVGFVTDLQNLGRVPPLGYIAAVLLSGGFAMVYAGIGIFLRPRLRWIVVPLIVLQFLLFQQVFRVFPLAPEPRALDQKGIQFLRERLQLSSLGVIFAVALGYALFIRLMRREGARFFKLKAEMDLAAEIHRQLVPPIATTSGGFEFYGESEPSGEVGGDLIDVVAAESRWVAYIADVAGHGVAPGVVMGMVKSAARMQLTASAREDAFLDRLNRVLYPLRAPQMFITFAYLASAADGLEYGVAGHPAILHCSAGKMTELVSENLPLGILPENRFVTGKVGCTRGDILLMVTDGLLEVEDKAGEEFGLGRVKEVLGANAQRPPAEIAAALQTAVSRHGGRSDDQSLLLVKYIG
jgi:serine phosphatase RsbU (regulator of sigma subunit)